MTRQCVLCGLKYCDIKNIISMYSIRRVLNRTGVRAQRWKEFFENIKPDGIGIKDGVCGLHFVERKPDKNPNHVDFVPTLLLTVEELTLDILQSAVKQFRNVNTRQAIIARNTWIRNNADKFPQLRELKAEINVNRQETRKLKKRLNGRKLREQKRQALKQQVDALLNSEVNDPFPKLLPREINSILNGASQPTQRESYPILSHEVNRSNSTVVGRLRDLYNVKDDLRVKKKELDVYISKKAVNGGRSSASRG